jgi:hypothetical protein
MRAILLLGCGVLLTAVTACGPNRPEVLAVEEAATASPDGESAVDRATRSACRLTIARSGCRHYDASRV